MSEVKSSLNLRNLVAGSDKRTTVILLLSPILLTTFKYYGSKEFYLTTAAGYLRPGNDPEWSAGLYLFASSFVLLGIIPLLMVKFYFKEPLASFGLQKGDLSYGMKALAIMAPILILASYLSSGLGVFRAEYPLYHRAGATVSGFAAYALLYLGFYFGWEIFFRGFMLFGLGRSIGPTGAILVQTLASCLAHIGKPAGEIYGSIIAGVAWGFVALRCGSIWIVLLLHWILGVSLDFFISYCR
jgi:membrane protease YdiL (CAAX protease family)